MKKFFYSILAFLLAATPAASFGSFNGQRIINYPSVYEEKDNLNYSSQLERLRIFTSKENYKPIVNIAESFAKLIR